MSETSAKSSKIWIDPPSGWLYGFPKLYDPACGKTMKDWLVDEGYPLDPKYVRQWFESDEEQK